MIKKIKIFTVLLLLLFLCLSLAACGNGESASTDMQESNESDTNINNSVIKLTDSAGRNVEIKKQAERIVDLTYLDGVRLLIQLGAENVLVGMSDMDHHSFKEGGPLNKCYIMVSKAVPKLKNVKNVGSFKEPNVQLIMSLKPDVIFMQREYKELADTLQKQANVPVVCIGGDDTLNFKGLELAAKIVGKEDRAKELIEFSKDKIKIVTDITDKITDENKPRVLFWVRPFIGDPRTSISYAPIEMAGALNVAAETAVKPKESFKITKEQIAAWNPEIIFKHHGMKTEEMENWHTVESILNEPSIKGVQAIKDEKVYRVRGAMRGWDTASVVTEVLYLAKIMYPEKFSDLDVEKEGNEIFNKYYGLDGLYTEMTEFLNLNTWE